MGNTFIYDFQVLYYKLLLINKTTFPNPRHALKNSVAVKGLNLCLLDFIMAFHFHSSSSKWTSNLTNGVPNF